MDKKIFKKKREDENINYMIKILNECFIIIYKELMYYKSKLKKKKQVNKSPKFATKNYTDNHNKFYYKNLPLKIEDLYSINFEYPNEFYEAIKQNFKISPNRFWLEREWIKYITARSKREHHPWNTVSPGPWFVIFYSSLLMFIASCVVWSYKYEFNLNIKN